MAASAFPEGWNVVDGLIGADVDVSGTALSGGAAIHLPATASNNASVVSDWYRIPDAFATGGGASATRQYGISVVLRADAVGGSNLVRVIVETAPASRTPITQTTIYNAPMPTVNNWEPVNRLLTLSAGSARWMRVRVDRPSSLGFNAYIDSAEFKQMPAGIRLQGSGATFTAAWATVGYAVTQSVYGYCTWDGANDEATIYAPGDYVVHAMVALDDSYDANDLFGMRIKFGFPAAGTTNYWYGSTVGFPAAYNAATNHAGLAATGSTACQAPAAGTALPNVISCEVIQYAGTLKTYGACRMTITRVTDR